MTKYTTNIPLARQRLRWISGRLRSLDHEDLAVDIEKIIEELMIRKPVGRRSSERRRTVTQAIRKEVERLLKNTDWPQEKIASKVGIDGGRVSEILREMQS